MRVESEMLKLLEGRDYVSVMADHAAHLKQLKADMESCVKKFADYSQVVSEIIEDNSYFAAERKTLASAVGARIQKAEDDFKAALSALDDVIAGKHSHPSR